jgi:type I restriction enzyme S subunit
LPPLPEQRKIAAILSSVDDAIEKTQAVIDQVQVVKRGLMQQLLTRGLPGRHTRFKRTDIGEMPEDWGVSALGEIASIGNGTTPSKKQKAYWRDGTIPWLPTSKVNDRIVQSADMYVTEKAIRETPLRVLPMNTLLIAMIGQGKTRGKTAILEIEACVNQNFAYVIPLRQISSRFLFFVLEHQYQALRASGRGSNQDALNCQIIKRFIVPLPTSDEQHRIVQILTAMDECLTFAARSKAGLAVTKSALMSVLLTGELRVKPDTEES